MSNRIHQHTILRIEYADTTCELLHNVDFFNEFLRDLVQDCLKMVICIEPRSVLVEDLTNFGLTGAVNLTTSHVAYHIFEDEQVIQLDVYSCKCYDTHSLVEFIYEYLDDIIHILTINLKVMDRNDVETYDHEYARGIDQTH